MTTVIVDETDMSRRRPALGGSMVLLCKGLSKRTGQPCGALALKGSDLCFHHAGNKKARGKALVKKEVMEWGLTDELIDPNVAMLRLVSQAVRRAERYAADLQEWDNEHDGEMTVDVPQHDGSVRRQPHPLLLTEAQERDRAAGFARAAIQAGIAERVVRLYEAFGQQLSDFIDAVIDELHLTQEQQVIAGEVIERKLKALEA